ncbi:MAG: imelysin family protein [Bacteroidota bacterium]
MKKYNALYLASFILVLAMAAFQSCNKSDDENTQGISIEEGRSLQLESVFDLNIIPLQNSHIERADALVEATNTFLSNPSMTSLQDLKNSWKSGFSVFKAIECYKIGTVQITFAHGAIHRWPAEITFIEDNIQGTATIDDDFINAIGTSSKGYAAIEYLLFAGSESETIKSFTSGDFAVRRGEYLAALVENLKNRAVDLKTIWTGRENEFKQNLGSGVAGSHNQLVNGYIALLETMKIRKLDKALNSNPYQEELLEAFYSEESLNALSENLDILWQEYAGNGTNQFTMSDYLIDVLDQQTLDTEIREAFQTTRSSFNAIQGPLRTAIINQRLNVEELRDQVMNLIRLYKVDLSSAANIVVTFNDNDGDS